MVEMDQEMLSEWVCSRGEGLAISTVAQRDEMTSDWDITVGVHGVMDECGYS